MNALRIAIIVSAIAGVAIFDASTERGVAAGVAYIGVVWLTHSLRRPAATWAVAAVCSALAVVGYFWSPEGGELWKVATNRTLVVVAIWGTALFSARHESLRRKQESRSRELDELNQQLQQSVAELEQVRAEQTRRSQTLLSVMEDLDAERRRLNDEMEVRRRVEARYQDLYDNSPDYYVSADAKTAVIEQCNRTLASALGRTREEIIGCSIFDLYHPDCLEAAQRAFEQFRQTGSVHNAELQLRRRDGARIDVILNVSAVRDQAGNIVRSRSVWRDVSERKRLEQRCRVMVESAPTAMVMINPQGRIVLANAETEKLFRWRRGDLLGKPIELLVPDRFRGQHPRHRDAFFEDPHARRMGAGRDLYGLRKDGSEFPVEIGLNPIETDEGVFVLSAIVDITQRKKIEQQIEQYAAELMRSNEELEQFAYSASHDLRAPLRAIDQLAEWTLEDHAADLPAAAQDDLRLLRSRVSRMDRLLEDLLTYSRVGRQDGAVDTIDCDSMVREVVDLLGPPKNFSIEVDELPQIRTHRAPLEQVFRNLINNAIKHHHRESGRIKVSGRKNGVFFEFQIEDDGPGIPAQFQEQVFGMFQTLQPRDKVEGSGMGLALVKKIVEGRGGTIKLESAEGAGATFRFTWQESYNVR